MLPSLDHDSSIPTGTSPSRKSNQKGLGGAISSKNGKKNGQAKDNGGGGVLAAVTKNASKMSKMKSSATPVESPEMAPVEPPIEALATPPSVGNPVTSPLLDALSSAAISRSSTQNTNEWAKNVPAYSSSPNNLINLGESPPTQPSSYDERLASFGWTTKEQRGTPPRHVASASPPARRRPLSYQTESNYPQPFEDHRSQMPLYAPRRSSMYSQHPRYAHTPNPPLPHQMQPHFYGAPDANLLLSPPGPGLLPGENGYYCGFDRIPNSHDSTKSDEEVVITGYDGGLNIHAISKRGLQKSLSLEGLRGGVYNAKILPWIMPGEPARHFPLVVVVVQGPVLPAGGSSSGEEAVSADGGSIAPNGSVKDSPKVAGRSVRENENQEYYQTTVEVYSLITKQYITTLLALPKIRLPIPSTSSLFRPPPPVGALTIRTTGPNIVLASGTTGETWLYRVRLSKGSTFSDFRCIGKVWTAVQHGTYVENTGLAGLADGEIHSAESMESKQYRASILSLSERWLAYCPSAPSSRVSLRATVPGLPAQIKVPGLSAHAPPQLPSVNCMVETPEGESMVKQIMQAGTQALIEGTTYISKQIGKQGAQVWNNYWNKSSQSQPLPTGTIYPSQPVSTHQFPPTHGAPTQTPPVVKDPGLVSILDIESLSQHASHSASPHPLATFKVPHGCSFVSFAPNGLALLTVSSKGDIQCVWDLMRIQYAKSSFLKGSFHGADSRGPHVRQIAQFSRMTVARIVDVAWSSPHGERAAMVTEPGTVHILDLPASAFTWPPPRRRSPSQKPDESRGDAASTALTAAGVATSAVSSLWTAARPLVRARRNSAVGVSAKTVTEQAGHGTQALAAGFSRSVGAATGRMNELRKAGSTKLHLPRSTIVPSRSCVLLLNHKRNDIVIVVGGGIVRAYTVKNRRADRPADKQKASRGARYIEYRLPSLPISGTTSDSMRNISPMGELDLTNVDMMDQQWSAKKSVTPALQRTESSIPQAEIESNAPYQPFHTDRRVGLYIYTDPGVSEPHLSGSAVLSPQLKVEANMLLRSKTANSPWAFGGPIHTTRLDIGPVHTGDEDSDSMIDHQALPTSAIERILSVKDNNDELEQIVITTRRRKGAANSGAEAPDADEEGFFEDDCEVLDFASQRV